MEFKKAMRAWARMCSSVSDRCNGCALPATMPNECATWVMTHTKDAEEIISKWAAEHPEKTIADDFFEKHPKAKKSDDGTPAPCAKDCGYIDKCSPGEMSCAGCWRRPLEEVE